MASSGLLTYSSAPGHEDRAQLEAGCTPRLPLPAVNLPAFGFSRHSLLNALQECSSGVAASVVAVRLLSLDFDPVYEPAERASFTDDVSVFDFDVVLWNPAETFKRYAMFSYGEQHRGLPSLPEATSVRMQADAARRRTEFAEFVNSGKALIVVASPPLQCFIDTGDREFSGTGRNQKTTRIVAPFDLWSALPSSDLCLTSGSGSRIATVGDGPFKRLLDKYSSRLRYRAVLSTAPGKALAVVEGTDRTVASLVRTEARGVLLILPHLDLRAHDDAGDDEAEDDENDGERGDYWSNVAPQFQADLLEALDQVMAAKEVATPAWAERYGTARQLALREQVAEQQRTIEKARDTLAILQAEVRAADARNQLFLGTGRALELEVKAALEALGATVTEPAGNRDDWLAQFPGIDAVVEVKGVAKSAAEKHAAQLEKWVAARYEQMGTQPKGILVVNAWREMPLPQRAAEAFPDQMVAYSAGRGHCLVTGLQLFVIREDIESNPDRSTHWRDLILSTSGRLEVRLDWRSVITTVAEADAG